MSMSIFNLRRKSKQDDEPPKTPEDDASSEISDEATGSSYWSLVAADADEFKPNNSESSFEEKAIKAISKPKSRSSVSKTSTKTKKVKKTQKSIQLSTADNDSTDIKKETQQNEPSEDQVKKKSTTKSKPLSKRKEGPAMKKSSSDGALTDRAKELRKSRRAAEKLIKEGESATVKKKTPMKKLDDSGGALSVKKVALRKKKLEQSNGQLAEKKVNVEVTKGESKVKETSSKKTPRRNSFGALADEKKKMQQRNKRSSLNSQLPKREPGRWSSGYNNCAEQRQEPTRGVNQTFSDLWNDRVAANKPDSRYSMGEIEQLERMEGKYKSAENIGVFEKRLQADTTKTRDRLLSTGEVDDGKEKDVEDRKKIGDLQRERETMMMHLEEERNTRGALTQQVKDLQDEMRALQEGQLRAMSEGLMTDNTTDDKVLKLIEENMALRAQLPQQQRETEKLLTEKEVMIQKLQTSVDLLKKVGLGDDQNAGEETGDGDKSRETLQEELLKQSAKLIDKDHTIAALNQELKQEVLLAASSLRQRDETIGYLQKQITKLKKELRDQHLLNGTSSAVDDEESPVDIPKAALSSLTTLWAKFSSAGQPVVPAQFGDDDEDSEDSHKTM
jgi:hypothetical protein